MGVTAKRLQGAILVVTKYAKIDCGYVCTTL